MSTVTEWRVYWPSIKTYGMTRRDQIDIDAFRNHIHAQGGIIESREVIESDWAESV